jgi:5'-nucleotidase (lipoprotein e(P4) family)
MARAWMFVVGCLMSAVSLGDDLTGRELVGSTLWMQRAPEYRALAAQTYRLATQSLAVPAAGSAAVEQQDVAPEVLARMPTAVVLDLDETVLDNSVYQARLLRDRADYDQKSWGQWIEAAEAELVPGAREYIATARKLGHTVFFLSNRDCTTPAPTPEDKCPAKTLTLKNLVALGIDLKPDPDHLFLRKERPEWTASSKTLRRALIAEKYRIVALVGDDLGDFVDPATYAADRERLVGHFGVNWFLLPNPIYGSWLNPYDTLEEKYAGLRTGDVRLALPGSGIWKEGASRVRIASWNIEYLMTPETQVALSGNCAENGGLVGGEDRTLPCVITKRGPRTADDYASLRNYAATLAADIVALQEVDGPDAAALVFPGYDYCFSTRAHPQKNGFAIRRGIPYRCEPEYWPLSLDDAVRRGVVVTFFPGTVNEFQLMSVHLKSGCPAGPLTAEGRNCELLSRQVAPLKTWIEDQARAGHRFGVLGDFNRRFSIEKGPLHDAQGRLLNVYGEISSSTLPGAKLTNVTGRAKFTPCTSDSEYHEYIDNILLGRDLAGALIRNSFVRVPFNDPDAKAHWLSDHCPVGIELRLR